MSSHDTPVKTRPTSSERQDRFEWSSDGTAPVLDEIAARQGVTGHNVRYVLMFGLIAIIVAFAAILAFDVYR
jgi:hypothetical protein